MSIHTAIQKMEETLRKKKAMRFEKDKTRMETLKERLKAKTEYMEKVRSAVTALEAEIEAIRVRIGGESPVEESTEPFDSADVKSEAKTAGGSMKDGNKKTAPAKKK
jgi:predicted  nucleic acid-binding Zn-ribbon protein